MSDETERRRPTADAWLCTMHLEGGPDDWGDDISWRADIVRTGGPSRHDHWWSMTVEEPRDPRMQVFRDPEGRVCRVVVQATGAVDRALDELGLAFDALGSPTLFGAPLRGWTWTFPEMDEPFPFRRAEPGGPR